MFSKILIRLSDDNRFACVFDKESGKAEVMSAISWSYIEEEQFEEYALDRELNG